MTSYGIGERRLPNCASESSNGFIGETVSPVVAEAEGTVSYLVKSWDDTGGQSTTFNLLRCQDGALLSISEHRRVGVPDVNKLPLLEGFLTKLRRKNQLNFSMDFVSTSRDAGYFTSMSQLFTDNKSNGLCGCRALFPRIKREWAIVDEAEKLRRASVDEFIDNLTAGIGLDD